MGRGEAAHLTQACPSDPSPEAHPELSDSDIKITPHGSPCPQEAPIQQERHIRDPCKRVARTGVQSAQDYGGTGGVYLTLTPTPPLPPRY